MRKAAAVALFALGAAGIVVAYAGVCVAAGAAGAAVAAVAMFVAVVTGVASVVLTAKDTAEAAGAAVTLVVVAVLGIVSWVCGTGSTVGGFAYVGALGVGCAGGLRPEKMAAVCSLVVETSRVRLVSVRTPLADLLPALLDAAGRGLVLSAARALPPGDADCYAADWLDTLEDITGRLHQVRRLQAALSIRLLSPWQIRRLRRQDLQEAPEQTPGPPATPGHAVDALLALAVWMLPRPARPRWQQEWAIDLLATPPHLRLAVAAQLLATAPRLRQALRRQTWFYFR